jgi:hypothetical protein
MSRFLIRFALLTAVFVTLQSCDKLYQENMDDCIPQIEETYKGVSVTLLISPSTSGAAAAEAAAENPVIYVFDSEGNILERRETVLGRREYFTYPNEGRLTIVGTINDGGFDVTAWASGMLRNEGLATLKKDGEQYLYPSDLFYGEVSLDNESVSLAEEHRELFAFRRTGMATVTVRGLQEFAGIDDDNFFIVTKNTATKMDYYGNVSDYDATYTPEGGFNLYDEWVTGLFGTMTTENLNPMVVEIWHRDPETGAETLIYSTTTNHDGTPIYIENDRTTNILIDFRAGISIRIEMTEWNVSFPWKTFL